MPQLSGLELLNAVKHRRPEIEVIMMTGHATVETALAAVKAGAYDYLIKPFRATSSSWPASVAEGGRAQGALQDRNRELETQLRERDRHLAGRAGRHVGPMREVTRMIDAVAYSAATVLVHGRERHRARSSWPAPSTPAARAAPSRSWRSTAARSPRRCSRASSSAT